VGGSKSSSPSEAEVFSDSVLSEVMAETAFPEEAVLPADSSAGVLQAVSSRIAAKNSRRHLFVIQNTSFHGNAFQYNIPATTLQWASVALFACIFYGKFRMEIAFLLFLCYTFCIQ
jgi:hypothetical protein